MKKPSFVNSTVCAIFAVYLSPVVNAAQVTSLKVNGEACENSLLADGLPQLKEMVLQEIAKALAAGRNPKIIIDLDDTVFSHQSRYLGLLQQFDKHNGSSLFTNLDVEIYPPREYKSWLPRFLEKIDLQFDRPALVERVRRYMSDRRNEDSVFMLDLVYSNIVEAIREWRAAGAEIIVVTAREEFQEAGTRAAIAKADFSVDEIYFDDGKAETVELYKTGAVIKILATPGAQGIALLDDNLGILLAIKAQRFNGMILIRALASLKSVRFIRFQ